MSVSVLLAELAGIKDKNVKKFFIKNWKVCDN
jgi:hypothetical protein